MKKLIFVLGLMILFSSFSLYAEEFRDVPKGFWAYEDIMSLRDKAIINGYPDGSFRPQNHLSRAELIKMISLMKKENEKSEVYFDLRKSIEDEHYYPETVEKIDSYLIRNVFPKDAVSWALPYYKLAFLKEQVLIEDEKISYKDYKGPITRGEIAVLIYRSLKPSALEKKGNAELAFTDEKDFGNRKEEIKGVQALDIINGYPDSTFRPDKEATRAEVSKMLLKLYDKNRPLTEVLEESTQDAARYKERFQSLETMRQNKIKTAREDKAYEEDLSYINEGERWYQGGQPKTGDVKIENGKKFTYVYGYEWLPWWKAKGTVTIESDLGKDGLSGIIIGEFH